MYQTGMRSWKLVERYFTQGFLVLIEDKDIFTIDWESHVQWETNGWLYHDIAVSNNGDIYAVTNRKTTFDPFDEECPFLIKNRHLSFHSSKEWLTVHAAERPRADDGRENLDVVQAIYPGPGSNRACRPRYPDDPSVSRQPQPPSGEFLQGFVPAKNPESALPGCRKHRPPLAPRCQ